MHTLLFGLLFLLPPFLKPWVLRRFCGARVGKHVSIGWFASIAAREIELGDYAAVRAVTLIRLDGVFRLGRQSEISNFCLVYGASDLEIGDQCYVGPQSLLNCDEPVRMGYYSALGPRSMVFTHGSFLPFTQGYWVKLAGVTIGSHVWCAAGVFLHPGVEIGDECFVNSRSVVTQSIAAGSVVEGNPARVVQQMEAVRRKMSPRRVDAALQQMLRDFARVTLEREMGIGEIQCSLRQTTFVWQGRNYLVQIVLPALGIDVAPTPAAMNATTILLLNQFDGAPPVHDRWFDVVNLVAPPSQDPIHAALRRFMQRYYGMRFRLWDQT
jgi:acetyltransferase-like isoleucine patch superfamily enzyme